MELQGPISSSQGRGVVFVLSRCVGTGSLTSEARPGGGSSLQRPQPLKPVVAFQALEFRCCWAWRRVGRLLEARSEVMVLFPESQNLHSPLTERRGSLTSSQARAQMSGGSVRTQREEHAGGQLRGGSGPIVLGPEEA